MERLFEFITQEALNLTAKKTLDDGRPRAYVAKIGDGSYDIGVFADGKTLSSGDIQDNITAKSRATAMAAVLDGKGLPASCISGYNLPSFREITCDDEIKFSQAKKLESGDDTPTIYCTKKYHPVALNGNRVAYYEAGIFNGQNLLKLGIFDDKAAAQDFAVEFCTAMQPATTNDENTGFVRRIAMIVEGFGGQSPSTEEIALTAKQLYYPGRPYTKVLTSVRAKMHNCDRYFDALSGGKWRLTEDGTNLATGSELGGVENWIISSITAAKETVLSTQATFFDEIIGVKAGEVPDKTVNGRGRLRAGIIIAMASKQIPANLASMVFGDRVGSFLSGNTKSIPSTDINWIVDQLGITRESVLCKTKDRQSLIGELQAASKETAVDIPHIRTLRDRTRVFLEKDRSDRDRKRISETLRKSQNAASPPKEISDFLSGGKHPGAKAVTAAVRGIRITSKPVSTQEASAPRDQKFIKLDGDTTVADIVHQKYKSLDYSHSIFARKNGQLWNVGIVNHRGSASIEQGVATDKLDATVDNLLQGGKTVRSAVESLVGLRTDVSSDLTRINYKTAVGQGTLGF